MKLALRPVSGEAQLFDPAMTGAFAEQMAELARTEQVPPWCGYIGWKDDVPLGFGGFVAPPDAFGSVEFGYLTFPANEGQGVASAVAAGLVEIARANGIAVIVAHTLAQEGASSAVLRGNHFVRDGEALDPDEGTVWRWRLDLG